MKMKTLLNFCTSTDCGRYEWVGDKEGGEVDKKEAETSGERDTETDRQAGRQAKTDRQADRQVGRAADRDIDRGTETDEGSLCFMILGGGLTPVLQFKKVF